MQHLATVLNFEGYLDLQLLTSSFLVLTRNLQFARTKNFANGLQIHCKRLSETDFMK